MVCQCYAHLIFTNTMLLFLFSRILVVWAEVRGLISFLGIKVSIYMITQNLIPVYFYVRHILLFFFCFWVSWRLASSIFLYFYFCFLRFWVLSNCYSFQSPKVSYIFSCRSYVQVFNPFELVFLSGVTLEKVSFFSLLISNH